MPRKTFRQKARKQLRDAKTDRSHVGLVLNYETQVMQSVATGYGVMSSLLSVKTELGEESEQYKRLEVQFQARISQCLLALVGMGLSHEEANARIIRGH